MRTVAKFLENLLEKFADYPVFIQIAVAMIILSIAIVILTHMGIVFHRYDYALRELRIRKARNIVTEELTNNLMLNDDIKEKDIEDLAGRLKKMYMNDRISGQVITDELIFYHHNLSGSTGKLLYSLYHRLDLIDGSIKKLRKRAWNVKAKGLREIREMPPDKNNTALISPLINNKNNDLRIEAQAAYLRLNKDNPFLFLDSADKELLDWHQMILFEIISNTSDINIPAFKVWLNSPNSSVTTFCIKLIVHYHQLDAIPDLIRLMDHPVLRVRASAVYALGRLDAEQSEQRMVDIYPQQRLPLKLKIIEALGLIRSGRNINFLKDQFLHSDEFSLIKAAACALANHPDFSKNVVFPDLNGISSKHKAIIEHCSNVLIRN